MSSQALAEFGSTIALAQALCGLEQTYPDPPDPNVPGQVEIVRGLRGGTIVLMVGAFEYFVSKAVAEHLLPFGAVPPRKTFDLLPEKLRVRSVFRALEHAMYGPRYGARGGKPARISDVVDAATIIAARRLHPEVLGRTDGNADSKRVGEVLADLGITDPFATLRPAFDAKWNKTEAQQFVHDKLDEIVLRRHQVAHTVSVLNISRIDVCDGIRFLIALAEAIDSLLESHVAAL